MAKSLSDKSVSRKGATDIRMLIPRRPHNAITPILRYFVFDYFRTRCMYVCVCVCRLLWLGTPNLLGAYITCGKCALANSRRVFFIPETCRAVKSVERDGKKHVNTDRQPAGQPPVGQSSSRRGWVSRHGKGMTGFFLNFFPRF